MTRAHRLHEARELRGEDVDASPEAEAGALLEAETAGEIHGLHGMMKAWLDSKRG